MKKEDLLKLADLLDRNPMYNCDLWEPHNNLNQAFECLEALGRDYDINCLGKTDLGKNGIVGYQVTINPEQKDEYSYLDLTLCLAICNAILKVVG